MAPPALSHYAADPWHQLGSAPQGEPGIAKITVSVHILAELDEIGGPAYARGLHKMVAARH